MSGAMTNAERSRIELRDREATTRANVVRQLGFAARPLTAQEVHKRCFPQSGERAYGWDSTLSRLRDMADEGLVVEVGGRWSTPARAGVPAPTVPEPQPKPVPVTEPPVVEPEPIAAPAAPEPQPAQESVMSTQNENPDLLMASCIEAARTLSDSPERREHLTSLIHRALVELRKGPRQVGILATQIGAKGADWRTLVDVLKERGWAERTGLSGRVAQLALTEEGARLVPESGLTEAQRAPVRERPRFLAEMVRAEQGQTPAHYRREAGWTASQIDHAARTAAAEGLIVRWGQPPDLRYYTPDKVPTAMRGGAGRRRSSSEPAAPVGRLLARPDGTPFAVAVDGTGLAGLNLHEIVVTVGGVTLEGFGTDEPIVIDATPVAAAEPSAPVPGPTVEVERHGPAMPLVADDRSEAGPSPTVAPGSVLTGAGWRKLPGPIEEAVTAYTDRLAKVEALLDSLCAQAAKMDALIDGAASTLADHIRLRAADKSATAERFVALEAQVGVLTRAAESHGDSIGSLEQSQSDARLRLADLDTIAILHGKEIDALEERCAGPHDVAAIAERLDTLETDVASFAAARQADAARLEEAMRVITSTGERIAGAVSGPLLRIAEVREGETGEGIVVLRGTRRDVREAVERCGAFGVVRLVSGGR